MEVLKKFEEIRQRGRKRTMVGWTWHQFFIFYLFFRKMSLRSEEEFWPAVLDGLTAKLKKINLPHQISNVKTFDGKVKDWSHQACRNPGMLESGIPARCDFCRQFVSYLQTTPGIFADNFIILTKLYAKMKVSEKIFIFQHSGVSSCLDRTYSIFFSSQWLIVVLKPFCVLDCKSLGKYDNKE